MLVSLVVLEVDGSSGVLLLVLYGGPPSLEMVYTLSSLLPAIASPQLSSVWVAHRDGHTGRNNAYKSQQFIGLSTGEDVEIGGGVHIEMISNECALVL